MFKKIILVCFLAMFVYANDKAKFYIGTGYSYGVESYSISSMSDTNINGAKFKVGYGIISSYAIELSLDYLKTDKDNFSQNDKERYFFNINLLKAFDFDIYIYPFAKLGFGAGYFDTDSTQKSTIHFSTYNAGVGFFAPITDYMDAEVSYTYRYGSYEKTSNTSKAANSNINSFYIGLNFRF